MSKSKEIHVDLFNYIKRVKSRRISKKSSNQSDRRLIENGGIT